MNRRHFLTTAGAAAAAGPLGAAAENDEFLLSSEKVVLLENYTAVCELLTPGHRPDIQLKVRLEQKDPESRWSTVIRLFKLTWEGQDIPIPARFWNDLDHFAIESYPEADLKQIPKDKQYQVEKELARLRKPRVYLSAESGTALIEWVRNEECDSHSTIRWIVSKSGIVLRHRHEPPHYC